MPGAEDATGILTYGYVEQKSGLMLEVICCAKDDGESTLLANPDETKRISFPIEALAGEEFRFCAYGDSEEGNGFIGKLEKLKEYEVDGDVEKSRSFQFLDVFRNKGHIDDVMVIIVRDGLHAEGRWVRIKGLGDKCFIGTLLEEPEQYFGYHAGDDVTFFLYEDDKKEVHLICDMNQGKKVTGEELADGSVLRKAVHQFVEEQNYVNMLKVMEILRDSTVWIPCKAIVGEEDQKQVMEMIEEAGDDLDSIAGKTFISKEALKLVPDILQNGEAFFFPVFSSCEEMGEYGNGFSKIPQNFMESIRMARANDRKLQGIVINAFSESMIIDKRLFEMIEKMESRIEENS